MDSPGGKTALVFDVVSEFRAGSIAFNKESEMEFLNVLKFIFLGFKLDIMMLNIEAQLQ